MEKTSGITTNYEITSITYGNIFVGVGTSSLLVKSVDGISWSNASIGYGNSISFNSVAFAGTNTYVAVGQTGKIITATGIGTILSSWIECKLINSTINFVGVPDNQDNTYNGEFKDISYSSSKNTFVVVGKISNYNQNLQFSLPLGLGLLNSSNKTKQI